MAHLEVVNEEDKEYFDGHSEIFSFGSYGQYSFKVYDSSDTAEALETIGQYCKEKGYNGLLSFDVYDKLLEACDGDEYILVDQWFPINGGEFYLQMPTSIV